jgi:polyisoprenyl-teichoic acid--peptidoglycan teichoic acid transferase
MQKVEQVCVQRLCALRGLSLLALLSFVLLLSACGNAQAADGATAHAAAATASPTPVPPTATPPPTPTPDPRLPLDRTLNILVLGSDQRSNEPNWRTDVMMIVTLDLDGGRAGVISIPRDLFLAEIPNHQPNRINVVDYLGEQDEPDGGGPKLLGQLISEHMGIPIHHFLRFDFNSFQAVVDALGGVEVDIRCAHNQVTAVAKADELPAGTQPGLRKLDGATALAFIRSRETIGGDLDRARRQQEFIWAVRNQIVRENLLPRIPALYAALRKSVKTDIDVVTAVRLVRFALKLEAEQVHPLVLAPPDLLTPGWQLGMSIFNPNWPQIRAAVQQIFDQPTIVREAATEATSTPDAAVAEDQSAC